MKKAVIEILYENEEELGGSFYKTIEEAEAHVREYQDIET